MDASPSRTIIDRPFVSTAVTVECDGTPAARRKVIAGGSGAPPPRRSATVGSVSVASRRLKLVQTFGYGWSDLERFTINAMKSAFIPFPERLGIIDDIIKPGYAVLIG